MANSSTRWLRLTQTAKSLEPWRTSALQSVPQGGWVRTMREALGMSTRQLGLLAKISQPGIAKLERAERDGGISLRRLRQIAAVLDCHLVYALVPQRPLDQMVRERAERLARERLEVSPHPLGPDNPPSAGETYDERVRRHADEILHGTWRKLWNERVPAHSRRRPQRH